jgi:hypothetical protein
MISWIAAHSTLSLSILGGVMVPLFVAFWSHRTGKQSIKAQTRQADASAYDTAREIWGDLLDDLKEQISVQRREIGAMKKRFDEEMKTLRSRLEDLESQRAGDRRAIHLWREYAKALLRALKSNGIEPPPHPDGLDLDE